MGRKHEDGQKQIKRQRAIKRHVSQIKNQLSLWRWGLPETSEAGGITLADNKKDVKIFNIREKSFLHILNLSFCIHFLLLLFCIFFFIKNDGKR
jgi:hypothetical protein